MFFLVSAGSTNSWANSVFSKRLLILNFLKITDSQNARQSIECLNFRFFGEFSFVSLTSNIFLSFPLSPELSTEPDIQGYLRKKNDKNL